MKSVIAAVALISTLVSAQSTSSNSSESSPYIPSSGISDGCHDYLVALDSNAALATCSSSLLAATSLFSPSSSSSTSSTTEIKSALSKLCSSSSQCSDSTIRQALTEFSGNCSAELSAGNTLVKSNYDVLYVLSPFTDAVCTKDTSGNYCALEIGDATATNASTSSTGSTTASTNSTTQKLVVQSSYQTPHLEMSDLYVSLSSAAKSAVSRLARRAFHGSSGSASPHGHALVARQANATSGSLASSSSSSSSDDDETALLPNATTFRSSNLPFLFLSGDMSSTQLCTQCTKNVLAAYVAFENEYPYTLGLTNSPILGGQVELWTQIGKVCGSGFTSSITSQSGSIASGAGRTALAGSAVVSLGAAALTALFAL